MLVSATLAGAAALLAVPGAPPAGPTRVRWGRRASFALCPVLVLVRPGSWLVLLAIMIATVAAGRLLWQRRVEAHLAARTTASVVEVCDLLAAELAAGRPPEAALHEAAAAWPGLRPVADTCRLGGDVPAALSLAAGTPGAGGLRLLAGAWSSAQAQDWPAVPGAWPRCAASARAPAVLSPLSCRPRGPRRGSWLGSRSWRC
jgi:tight adherence protein B